MSDSLDRSIQVGNLRLYPDLAGRWTVSDGGMWLPGIYDSREAATTAAGLPDEVLHNTLRPICHVDGENRPITLADVEAAAETLPTERRSAVTRYATVTEADDVTEEILDAATSIHDGWYPEGRIDWDVLDRLDGTVLDDGAVLDLGDDMTSPAIRRIKAHVRDHRAGK